MGLPLLWLFAFDWTLRHPPPSLMEQVAMTHVAGTLTALPSMTETAAAGLVITQAP